MRILEEVQPFFFTFFNIDRRRATKKFRFQKRKLLLKSGQNQKNRATLFCQLAPNYIVQ
jgi:hypothetical protein